MAEGVIDYADWKNNPKDLAFKKSLYETEVVYLKPEAVERIEIPSRNLVYIGAYVLMDRSSDDLKRVTYSKEPDFFAYHLFLKEIVKGSASLYGYYEGPLVKFFYKTLENDSIQQLVMKYYTETYGKVAINNQFRRQLWVDVACDDAGREKIKNLEYETRALKKYFESYNHCSLKGNLRESSDSFQGKSDTSSTQSKQFYSLKLVGGLNFSNVTVNGRDYFGSYYRKYSLVTGIRIGFESEFILPYGHSKYAVLFEPTFSTLNTGARLGGGGIKYSSIIYPAGFRYYPAGKAPNSFYLNIHIVPIFTTNFQPSELVVNRPELRAIKIQPNSAFSLGFGVNQNRFGFDFRYTTSRDLVYFRKFWEANLTTASLAVSYKLYSRDRVID